MPLSDLPLQALPVGGAFILIGLYLWLVTVKLFSEIGRGTLAPWNPTRRLVVAGIYRNVRNPMITGVASIILGEAVIFGSGALLLWLLFFVVGNHFYFIFSEEPGLEKRFGEEYLEYKRNVPRWIPRPRQRDR